MTSAGRIGWKAVRVLGAGASTDASQLVGTERLAALYRFQNAGRSPGHRFFAADVRRETEILEPDHIDWASFPVIAALEAVTYDELRRLRMLLTESGEWDTSLTSSSIRPTPLLQAHQAPLSAALTPSSTPPHGIASGGDLRR